LLAAFYSDSDCKALKAAGPIKTDYPLASTPLRTLVKEIALRPDIKSFYFARQRRAAKTEESLQ
jgi:oxaloacetate decarboxylase alpha subunit